MTAAVSIGAFVVVASAVKLVRVAIAEIWRGV